MKINYSFFTKTILFLFSLTISLTSFSQEIEITGNNIIIGSGSTATTKNNNTRFFEASSGIDSVDNSFVIKNLGTSDLVLSGTPLIQSSNSNFIITDFPDTTIKPCSSSTFTVRFAPSSVGLLTGTITIINNDADEGTYTFNVSGESVTPRTVRWVNNQGATRPSTVNYQGITYNVAATTYTTIQSAINAAGNNDIVYITDGIYQNPNEYSSTNCSLFGTSQDLTLYLNVGYKNKIIITSETGDYRTSNAKLVGYGFNIYGGSANTVAGLQMDSIRVNGFWNSNCCSYPPSLDIRIINNKITNTRGHGVKTDSWGSGSGSVINRGAWEIIGNHFENIGFYNGNGNCLTPALVSALWLAEAGNGFEITDNTIINTKWAGILCDGYGNANGSVTIARNVIDQTENAGIQVGFGSGNFYYPENATISSNIITNANTSNQIGIGAITLLQSNIKKVSILNNDISQSFNGLAIEIAGWDNSSDTTIVRYNNFYNLTGGYGVTHIGNIAPNGLFGTGDDLAKYKFDFNYWGASSGPTYVTNPGGTGVPLWKDTNTLGGGTYSLNDFNFSPFYNAPNTIDSIVSCVCAPPSITYVESACDSFAFRDSTYYSSGNYTRLYMNGNECDSVVYLNLTVNYTVRDTIKDTVCDAISFGGNTITLSGSYNDTLTAANTCDSIVTLQLIVNYTVRDTIKDTVCDQTSFAGMTLTSSGNYNDTLTAANTCDSIVTLQLVVNYTVRDTIKDTVCNQTSFAGMTLTSSGNYNDTLTAANACDSIVTLQLVVNYTIRDTIKDTVCDQTSFAGMTLTSSGNYSDTLTAANACDSIVTLQLIVNYTVRDTIKDTVCDQTSFAGMTLTSSGNYNDTLTAANTCDSIVTLQLVVNYTVRDTIKDTVCDQISFAGMTLTSSGTYNDTLTAANTCDSIVTLQLIVNYTIRDTIKDTVCDATSFAGMTLTSSGTYYDTLTAANACDSIITLQLTVNYTTRDTSSVTACNFYVMNGDTLFANGTYSDTLIASTMCDSILTIHLTVKNNYNDTLTALTICSNDSTLIFGSYENVAGWYTDSLSSAYGCDSIINVELIVKTTSSTNVNDTICKGDSINIAGTWYTSGMVTETITGGSANGCDSLVYHTIILDSLGAPLNLGSDIVTCVSNSVTLNGGVYDFYSWSTGDTTSSIVVNGATAGIGVHDFWLTVSDSATNCTNTDTVRIEFISCVGISELNFEDLISIYPNPIINSDKLIIDFKKLKSGEMINLALVDNLGKTITKKTLVFTGKHSLEISDLENGIYYLVFDYQSNKFAKKLILNR